tara:strand:- start:7901 stop:8842 length:942 start_codon:yes stop_codon:yes gene_type:complete
MKSEVKTMTKTVAGESDPRKKLLERAISQVADQKALLEADPVAVRQIQAAQLAQQAAKSRFDADALLVRAEKAAEEAERFRLEQIETKIAAEIEHREKLIETEQRLADEMRQEKLNEERRTLENKYKEGEFREAALTSERRADEFAECKARELGLDGKDGDAENTENTESGPLSSEEIGALQLIALSPEGACEQYARVKLNTMISVMAKINRQLARAVADKTKIAIDKTLVEPDEEADTLCLMNDTVRDEILDSYRSKGWNVEIMTGHLDHTIYVFEPSEMGKADKDVVKAAALPLGDVFDQPEDDEVLEFGI